VIRNGGTEVELDELLPADLPRGDELVRTGKERGRQLPVGRSRYTQLHNVASDRAYKENCRQDGTITTYINLGYKTWSETRDALDYLVAEGKRLGYRLDRVSLIPDRRMGLPPELRDRALEETGIMMLDDTDWTGAATDTAVQPVWNDHNVGSPAAVVNTEAAIRAGFGYIGNLAQHQYGYPLWQDDVEQMSRAVEAAAMIAAKKGDGLVLESYIEDGFCASFHDLATSLGWCLVLRYIAETLIGAAHSQSYGSTFSDPVRKQAFGLALEAINVDHVPPSFTHGDTNSFGVEDDYTRNAVIVATDVMYTVARELKHPTGAAIHATPVSEATRIPTVDELVESLVIANEAERRVRACQAIVDWRPIYELRDQIVAGGRRVFDNILRGLASIGVDENDPLQLLLATRRLGASRIEQLFGAGLPDNSYPRGFKPVVASDTLLRLLTRRDDVLREIGDAGGAPDLSGITVVAASGDIHEYGLFVLTEVLGHCGARVVDLGTSVTTPELAQVAVETDAEALALSTYNGMALSLGQQLLGELERRRVRPVVFMGGRLNEDLAGQPAADVRKELRAAGVVPCDSVQEMVLGLREGLTTGLRADIDAAGDHTASERSR
jgi:methylmalonyl-CoA mutase cobalamin-binding subunit